MSDPRERVIEAMAWAIGPLLGLTDWKIRNAATSALDAALAVHDEKVCESCYGTGDGDVDAGQPFTCPDCCNGTVPGPTLLTWRGVDQ